MRTKHVGHIRDVRRLVVAVSRARLGLYVFARLSLFRTCPELQPVIEQFTSRPNELHLTPWERYSESLATPASMHDVMAAAAAVAAANGKLSAPTPPDATATATTTTNGGESAATESTAAATAAPEKVPEGEGSTPNETAMATATATEGEGFVPVAAGAARKVEHVALEQLPHAPVVCEGVHQLSHYVQELYNARVAELTQMHQAEIARQQEMQKSVCF